MRAGERVSPKTTSSFDLGSQCAAVVMTRGWMRVPLQPELGRMTTVGQLHAVTGLPPTTPGSRAPGSEAFGRASRLRGTRRPTARQSEATKRAKVLMFDLLSTTRARAGL